MCQACSRRYSTQSVFEKIRAEERQDVIIKQRQQWDHLGDLVKAGEARVNAALMKGARILPIVSHANVPIINAQNQ